MARSPANPRSPSYRPWHPTAYEAEDVYALQNLAKGKAGEHQQIKLLNFIVHRLCGTYQPTFIPDSERETAFAEGKRNVGLELVKLINLPVEQLKKLTEQGRPAKENDHGE